VFHAPVLAANLLEPEFSIIPESAYGAFSPERAGGAIMADKNLSQYFPENPDPQEKTVSGDDIKSSQEQPRLPERLPQSLIEWLVRINRRYLVLDRETTNDTS
jgi:hypothetical protein